jgi:hypothetical protein
VAKYWIEFRNGYSPVTGSSANVYADEWTLVGEWFHFMDSGQLIKTVMAQEVLAITKVQGEIATEIN